MDSGPERKNTMSHDEFAQHDLEHKEAVDEAITNQIGLSHAQKRRLNRKIDFRVLPMIGIVYAVSVIDRNNIGAAKVLGLSEDLNLGTGPRYSLMLLMFFPSYTLADLPSNWIISRVVPKYYLSFLMLSWGAVLTGMAFTDNWQVMTFLRFLLGIFEGGILPGMVYVISCW